MVDDDGRVSENLRLTGDEFGARWFEDDEPSSGISSIDSALAEIPLLTGVATVGCCWFEEPITNMKNTVSIHELVVNMHEA